MTTSSDDLTTELPEFDATTPLPTIPAPTVGVGTDATTELPTSSPDLSSDPLAVFRESPTAQMPTDPFRSDAGTASQAGASGAQGSQAQAGTPAGSVGTGGRTAFDPASTGESTPRRHEAGARFGYSWQLLGDGECLSWVDESGVVDRLGVGLVDCPPRGVDVRMVRIGAQGCGDRPERIARHDRDRGRVCRAIRGRRILRGCGERGRSRLCRLLIGGRGSGAICPCQ